MADRIRYEDIKPHMTLARNDLPYPEGAIEVINAELACSKGGGFSLNLKSILEDYPFHEATEEEMKPKWVRGKFGIDDPDFIGWHWGDRWNGWATPCFELEEAKKIGKAWFGNKDEYTQGWWHYHELDDTIYTFSDQCDDIDIWTGHDIETSEGTKHVYSIGAYSWTWCLFEEDENAARTVENAV